MSIEALTCFLNDVVRFHELATGLKALSSHDQIIAFGQAKVLISLKVSGIPFLIRILSSSQTQFSNQFCLRTQFTGRGHFDNTQFGGLC